MIGRFPPDLFVIVAVPLIAFAFGIFLPPLLIRANLGDQFAVVVAVAALTVLIVFGTIALVRRRRAVRPHR